MDPFLVFAYQIGTWSAALVAVVVAVVVARSRDVSGRRPFIMLNVAAFLWASTSAVHPFLADAAGKLWMHKIGLIGSSTIGAAWCSYGIQFGLRKRTLPNRVIALLYLIPGAVIIAGLTNDWHGLVWPSMTLTETPVGWLLVPENGLVVWILTVYSYIVFAIGTFALVMSSMRLGRTYRVQSIMLIIAALFPMAGDVLHMFQLVDLASVDLTPVLICISCVFVLWTMVGYGLFNVLPIAHDVLFRNMNDGGIVVDSMRRIVDMNPMALSILGVSPDMIGETADALVPYIPEADRFLSAHGPVQGIVEITGADPRWLEIQANPIIDRSGQTIGLLLMLQDVTERKAAETQREQLVREVQNALANVRTLSGMLPICYQCKKVRDDNGYWKQVEAYVTEQTGSRFSHGLCPKCFEELYPDVAKKQRERSSHG